MHSAHWRFHDDALYKSTLYVLTNWVWVVSRRGKGHGREGRNRIENGRGYNDEKERAEGKERDELDCSLATIPAGAHEVANGQLDAYITSLHRPSNNNALLLQ